MRTVDTKCPNCAGNLEKQGDIYVCVFCGATFDIDYDDSDVEYERLKTVAEQEEKQRAHEKELLERQFELEQQAQIESEKRQIKRERQQRFSASVKKSISSLIALAFLVGMGYGIYRLYIYMMEHEGLGGSSSGSHLLATPTPAPNYHPAPDDFKDSFNDFLECGRKMQWDIESCTYWDGNGSIKTYDKTDVKLVDAYIITDIPEVKENNSNRLVLIYEVTWYNEDRGEHIFYDAVYFEGIRVNPNGNGIISDFNGQIIWRSDAAWGWAQAYSFEEYAQCYRENITALGGVVTKLDFVVGEATVDVDVDLDEEDVDAEDADVDDEAEDEEEEDYDEDDE